METFLEKAGYTTKTLNVIVSEMEINKNALLATLQLSGYDLSLKMSWNNERDRDRLYCYLKTASDMTEEERDRLGIYSYASIESRLDALTRKGLSTTKPSTFISSNVAENLISKRMNEIILEGEI